MPRAVWFDSRLMELAPMRHGARWHRLLALSAPAFACTEADLTWVEPPPAAPVAMPEARAVPLPDAGAGTPALPASGPLHSIVLAPLDAPALTLPVPGCHLASPIAFEGGFLTAAGADVRSFSREGALRWVRTLPAPSGEQAFVVATPAVVGGELFVSYHTLAAGAAFDVNGERLSQRVVALDAESGELSSAYDPIVLEHVFMSSEGAPVPFRADRALGRSALVAVQHGATQQLIVSFGNARDLQPWHGFAFAIDIGRWRSAGSAAALSGRLIVTPEAECGPEGSSGSRERRCGGGLWAPSGPLVLGGGATRDATLIFAPGNGQLDLARHDYANTLMRTSATLEFDPGCGSACEGVDAEAPSADCAASCRDLFIPRDVPGDRFPQPESGACDGLSLFECWQALDYVGGSTPAALSFRGYELLAYPAKDGAVYLIDASHLGRLYDRRQLVAVCGTRQDPCDMDWAGMIVTQPAVVERDPPLLIVPTFMPDRTHPAGVVGLELQDGDAGPTLRVAWRYPDFSTPDALAAFRVHPSRVALTEVQGNGVALIVETRRRAPGRLLALDAMSGRLLAASALSGPGYRFTLPLVLSDRVVVPSCDSDTGPSHLQLFALRAG